MTQGQEQEQLLEDASTLLMFASAAARQRSPPLLNTAGGATESAPAIESSRFRGTTGAEQNVQNQDKTTETKTPKLSHAQNTPAHQLATHLPPASSSAMYPSQPFPSAVSTPLQAPQRRTENVLPSFKPIAITGHSSGSIDTRLSPAGSFNYAPQVQPNARPNVPVFQNASAHSNPLANAHAAAHMMTHQGYGYYAQDPVSLPRMYGAGYPMQNLAQAQTLPRRQSVAQTVAVETSPKENVRKTQSASPPEGGSERSERLLPQKLVPLSPKPPQSDQRSHNFEPTNPKSDLPVRGSFQVGHKRTVSETSQKQLATGSPIASPGLTNNTPFSRGINVESGKRSTDNAMIAAAALAVAADIPFPLKINEKPSVTQRPELSVETSTISRELGPAMPITHKSESNNISSVSTDRSGAPQDESVVTEPEEDENKTEDEPESSAVRENFNPADLPQSMAPTSVDDEASDHKVVPLVKTESQNEPEPEAVLLPGSFSEPVDSKPPPLATYKVDPDAGTIGCICGIEEDDGFTIQCDVCYRWQHCSCMGYLTNEEVPEDEYRCYYCDEMKWNKIDPEQCRIATAARLDMDKSNDAPQKPAAPKRKTSSSGNEDKKRRKSEKEVKAPAEKQASEKRKSSSAASPNSKMSVPFEIHNKENPLLEDGATAEPYQSVYYRLDENDYKTPEVKNLIMNVGVRSEKAAKNAQTHEIMSLNQYKLLKFSKVSLPNHQKYLQERNELRRNKGFNKTTIKVKTYSENPKQKFVSVPKVGLFISDTSASISGDSVIPAGTVVIEYLGEVDLWQSHIDNKINQYSLWGTVKPRVAKVRVSSPDAGTLDFVLDSRFVGNESRFIRRSCATTANCEIRPVYIPQLQTFKFLVVTTQPIVLKGDKSDEELRIPWDWDPLHPISDMIQPNRDGFYEEGKKFEDFAEEEKAYLIACVDTILNFVECGCNTSNISNQCAIFKIKKATSYLLRSNRKASNLGGGTHKSKEELVMPKKIRQYISWSKRLIDRDQKLFDSSPYASGQLATGNDIGIETDTAGVENSNDKPEHIADSQIPKDVKFCKTTFKQNLLAQQSKLSVTNYEVAPGNVQVFDAEKIVGDITPKVLAIPLTSEVLAKIKNQVKEAFKPLQKLTPKINTSADVKEVKAPEQPLNDAITVEKSLPAVTEAPVAEMPALETKPPVVKKFSFADYKKKMK